jgi:hypothetical protein
MRVYVAGRWSQKEYLKEIREKLSLMGHEVTSRWLDLEKTEYDVSMKPQQALDDCHDVDTAQVLIAVFQPEVTGYQGTLFEIGLAMGIGLQVVVLGFIPHFVFYYLPTIRRYDSWDHFRHSVNPATLRPLEPKA